MLKAKLVIDVRTSLKKNSNLFVQTNYTKLKIKKFTKITKKNLKKIKKIISKIKNRKSKIKKSKKKLKKKLFRPLSLPCRTLST